MLKSFLRGVCEPYILWSVKQSVISRFVREIVLQIGWIPHHYPPLTYLIKYYIRYYSIIPRQRVRSVINKKVLTIEYVSFQLTSQSVRHDHNNEVKDNFYHNSSTICSSSHNIKHTVIHSNNITQSIKKNAEATRM